jgi:translation elongation factor EF-1beta
MHANPKFVLLDKKRPHYSNRVQDILDDRVEFLRQQRLKEEPPILFGATTAEDPVMMVKDREAQQDQIKKLLEDVEKVAKSRQKSQGKREMRTFNDGEQPRNYQLEVKNETNAEAASAQRIDDNAELFESDRVNVKEKWGSLEGQIRWTKELAMSPPTPVQNKKASVTMVKTTPGQRDHMSIIKQGTVLHKMTSRKHWFGLLDNVCSKRED